MCVLHQLWLYPRVKWSKDRVYFLLVTVLLCLNEYEYYISLSYRWNSQLESVTNLTKLLYKQIIYGLSPAAAVSFNFSHFAKMLGRSCTLKLPILQLATLITASKNVYQSSFFYNASFVVFVARVCISLSQ